MGALLAGLSSDASDEEIMRLSSQRRKSDPNGEEEVRVRCAMQHPSDSNQTTQDVATHDVQHDIQRAAVHQRPHVWRRWRSIELCMLQHATHAAI